MLVAASFCFSFNPTSSNGPTRSSLTGIVRIVSTPSCARSRPCPSLSRRSLKAPRLLLRQCVAGHTAHGKGGYEADGVNAACRAGGHYAAEIGHDVGWTNESVRGLFFFKCPLLFSSID